MIRFKKARLRLEQLEPRNLLTGPFTLWAPATMPATPDANDGSAVELGFKFQSDVAGSITGLRFYKSAANTGTHVGSLWTSSGALLAQATFTSETASGWQQVDFATPVAINANTTYVASYHTNAGHYADDLNYFASSGFNNTPLHALKSGADGTNGLYAYGSASTFPTQSYLASNYWVDVVFTTPSLVLPTVTGQTPAPGAALLPPTTPVKAVFNESVVASTISFTLKDAAGNPVSAKVTYDDPAHTATLLPSAPLANGTTYTATVSGAQDTAGNAMGSSVSWSFTTSTGTGPFTLWAPATTPAIPNENDGNAVELGVKFQSDVSGFLTGLRFYKSAANTGTHVGSLWTSGGALLAQATFTSESTSGWQTVTFSTPVAISANTTYVASYHTNVGHYAVDRQYFAGSGFDNTPLHALKDGADGPNGVYAYSSSSAFPAQSYQACNYWVDVLFTPTSIVLPTVTRQTPASGATSVATNAVLKAVFNESVLASTIAFTLKDAAGNAVNATVAYDDPSHTVTLTPSALLNTATTYVATVSGAKDSSGNVMTTTSWSFTTEAAPALTSQSPASGATNVATTSTVQAVFNKAVVASTISFTLKDPANNPVAGTFTYNATTNTATFTPSALLATATTLTATVSGAKDTNGNLMAPVSWSFSTEAAPALTGTTPASGATNVATKGALKATFNKSVVASSIGFGLQDAAGTAVTATLTYDDLTHVATLTPAALLSPSTTYTATVSGAKDSSGNGMTTTSWSFTTEAAPALTSQTPVAGATNVATTSVVKATFTKAVVASTITFVLKDAAGNAISATVAYDDPSHTVTLTPAALLSPSTTFTATVSGVQDSSGNGMAATSWSFTTEAAPALTSQTPAAGATNVATTSTVQAGFSKAVVASTISFTLKDGAGTAVNATLAYNDTTHVATLTPAALLATSTTYTATVSGAKDASGNLMAPVSWSFTTEAAPALTAQAPTSGATNVGTPSIIKATFNKSVVASTISFVLKDAAGTAVTATLTYDDPTHVATLTPAALLSPSTTYTATVSGAKDSSGNGMTTTSWSFTTEAAPALTSTSPAASATNVVTTSTVQAVFNKGVQASTISFTLKDSAGNPVTGTVAYDDSNHIITLTPASLLSTATTYTATVSGAKDSNGNVMATTSWSFTTEAAPALTSESPTAGATNVVITATVQAVFNKAVVASTIAFAVKDPAGNPLAGSVSYNATTNTATFTPSASLTVSTTYTATVSGAKDASGNLMIPFSWSFTSEPAPTVTSTTPAASATNVGTNSVVQAVFNKAVAASTISFVLKDPSGAVVPGTVTYDDPSHTATLTPNAPLANATTYTATVSGAKDASGNVMAGPVTWSFTTVASPLSLWTPTTTPANPDANDNTALEVGVKLRSDVAGFLSGIRFYKGTANTGTHVGSLWTSTGTLLAQATFTGESASGWQQVLFNTPVAISANTTYVASYHTNVGHYAADNGYFASAGFDNAPLHALKDGVDGTNGVFAASASPTFPTLSFQASNYWVDVLFATIAVTITAPAPGTKVKDTVTVSADAASPVGIASIQFQLDGVNLGPAITSAPYSVSWDTTKVPDGNHVLTAVAVDLNGKGLASAPVTVQVGNTPPPANLILDGSKTFQKIDGFGANLSSIAWNSGKVTSALDTLINVQGDNLFRVIIETVSGWEDTFNPDPYTNNAVYATPKFTDLWNSIAYLNSKNVPVMLNVMGYLPSWLGPNSSITIFNEDAWADMIASMVYYGINTAKVKIDYLSPMNEEDVGFPEGPSIDQFQHVTLMNKLLAKLAAHGLGNIPVVGPDVANVDNLTNKYLPQIFGSSTLTSALKHVTFHDYFGKAGTVDTAVKNSGVPGLNWWVTEYAGGLFFDADKGVPVPDEWDFSQKSFQYLVQYLQAGASGATVYDGVDAYYQHHGAVNSLGQVAWDQTTDTYTPRKRLYANAQVFKFVKPGEMRVASSTTLPGLVQIAFADPAAGRVTITGENTGNTEVLVSGSLTGGLSATSFQAYFTNASAGMDLKKQPDVVVKGGRFTITVPAHTIFTLYSSLSGSGGGDSGLGGPDLPVEIPRPVELMSSLFEASPERSERPVSPPANRPWEWALALDAKASSTSPAWEARPNPTALDALFSEGRNAWTRDNSRQENSLVSVNPVMGTSDQPSTSPLDMGPDPFVDLFRDQNGMELS
jgi:hypothetical protein